MITNIYLPGCRRIGIQGGRLRRPRRRAVVGSIWAGDDIGIGACQELDPIADRGPAVFGIPCSRRSDSVTGGERSCRRRRCIGIQRVEAPLAVDGGSSSPGHIRRGSVWPAMGCMRYPGRAAADRQPIATHRAIHHRRRESAEIRVTRGRGRV